LNVSLLVPLRRGLALRGRRRSALCSRRDGTSSCSSSSRPTRKPSRRLVAWASPAAVFRVLLFQHKELLLLLLLGVLRPASRHLLLQQVMTTRRRDAVRSALRSVTGGSGFAARPFCACCFCCSCVAQSLRLVLLQHGLLLEPLLCRSVRPRVPRALHLPAARAH